MDEIEYEELGRAVGEYRGSLTSAYWFRDAAYLAAGGPVAERMVSEIAALSSAQRYMGHQLLAAEFRSFDLQSAALAVVTSRETWQDALYALGQYSPEIDDALLTQRGPYVLDATYTLELVDRGPDLGTTWQVTNVVYAGEPPAFP